MENPWTLEGTSGLIAVHTVSTDTGDPAFVIEQTQLSEIVDLPDLATALEVYHLLGRAILRAEIRLHLEGRNQAG